MNTKLKRNFAPVLAAIGFCALAFYGWKQNHPPHECQRDWAGPWGENVCSICGSAMTNLAPVTNILKGVLTH